MQMDIGTLLWAVSYVVVFFWFTLYGIHRYYMIATFLRHRKNEPAPMAEYVHLPLVTVQLPVYNERYVVERLMQAVSELDYPRELLQVQLLDDSNDDSRDLVDRKAEELRAAGLDIEVLRREDRVGYKAGALAYGLKRARGEFLFILDADFVPSPGILKSTVHYFTDPKIGMIQTRWGHLNRTHSMLTRVQAMFLDGHLLLEQTARSRSGRFFNFNGTAGLWRKSCIEEAGGWQHDTLTEDLDLSYRAQLKGWRFVFLPREVTPAELPVDMNGFKSQQHRWTKGSIQTCKKLLPRIWKAKLPLPIKLEATIHLTSNFMYLLMAFLCLLLNPHAPNPFPPEYKLYLIDLPVFLSASLSVVAFYLCAQCALHPRAWFREILYLPVLLALGIGLSVNNARAVLEAVFNHETGFNRTPKYGSESIGRNWHRLTYRPLDTLLPWMEMLFAAYFTYCVVHAIVIGQFFSVPFLLLFQFGFLYVACSSLYVHLKRSWMVGNRRTLPAT